MINTDEKITFDITRGYTIPTLSVEIESFRFPMEDSKVLREITSEREVTAVTYSLTTTAITCDLTTVDAATAITDCLTVAKAKAVSPVVRKLMHVCVI